MSSDPVLPHTRWTRVRTVLNWINLSTPLGLLIARIGGASITRRGRGTYLATGYRFGFPVASAFTIGSVIASKHDLDWVRARPVLLQHEDRHCTQYAFVLGVVMLPFYFLCVGISYAIAGDHSSYNPFERLANLADGNYPPPRTRFSRKP
ncbi:hypothetical protein [Aeromicrobium ginsengisoli]|uniref:DUF4157 domain-containing protein n=1 Tax=Aeromicrobium ginsengisoli TaxID=363867 RepID=A0A5M4FAU0_9ACTN|nr:hypothetical protein [Aeromicrobium ginsengisoli]KAA1394369.1 hypothetical protein ESP70_019415 [Aeromicrobium ginsengisoli]